MSNGSKFGTTAFRNFLINSARTVEIGKVQEHGYEEQLNVGMVAVKMEEFQKLVDYCIKNDIGIEMEDLNIRFCNNRLIHDIKTATTNFSGDFFVFKSNWVYITLACLILFFALCYKFLEAASYPVSQ